MATNQGDNPVYMNPDLPVDQRVDDLVSRMTLEEKVSQMVHEAKAIERLGVPEYNWWNECLHGVARAGVATVFPQAIGMAATWNLKLMARVATAISDEGRAKYHEAIRQGNRGIYFGLTFWTPNINIFRDPRWGRGQETYGEDPYLTARMGVTFVKGLQGDDAKYLKSVATPKHYAVHSGPENLRHTFDAKANPKDLRETYLYAFKACVQEAKAESIMGAYNRTNGEPCCSSKTLLEDILRKEWGFTGYVVSDCGAIDDIYAGHKVVKISEKAAAVAVESGCDLCCGRTYDGLVKAVQTGLLPESAIDQAVKRLFRSRFRLGMFDPQERVPYAKIPYSVNDCAAHRALALETARESMVLLKNENDFLPLDKKDIKSIAVIGPNADSVAVLCANYMGTPSKAVTALEGIRGKTAAEVIYARGCKVMKPIDGGVEEAVAAARKADVVIFVGGLGQVAEGEEGQEEGVEDGDRSQGDRTTIELPEPQEAVLRAVHATGKPIVVVLMNGSAVAVNWAESHAKAIVEAWYPGEEGGTAVADVLFGDYNPGGRLPVTFYKSTDQLPPFEDYNMTNRTYRYFTGEVLYPFGYGLSFTQFQYCHLQVEPTKASAGQTVRVSIEVQNVGRRDGDEVVQVYVSDVEASVRVPTRWLAGFERVHLKAGETKTVNFTLPAESFKIFDEQGNHVLEPGEFVISVGGGQPGTRCVSLSKKIEIG